MSVINEASWVVTLLAWLLLLVYARTDSVARGRAWQRIAAARKENWQVRAGRDRCRSCGRKLRHHAGQ